jgi:gamma-glutamyl:cysteine ligase YbdK (ATP-grasp superfamily)
VTGLADPREGVADAREELTDEIVQRMTELASAALYEAAELERAIADMRQRLRRGGP